jgi:hypothetical protein
MNASVRPNVIPTRSAQLRRMLETPELECLSAAQDIAGGNPLD